MGESVARLEDYAKPSISIEWAPKILFDPSSVEEIIEDVLVAGGMSVWYGEPGAGKTTLLLDAMLRMPREKLWLGKRLQRRAALLVAAESPNSPRMRLEAYRQHHGPDIGAFGIIPHALNLMDGSQELEDLIDLVIAEGNKLPVPVGLIAIDTVARVMPGGDENSAQDMGRLVTAGDRIRKETGAHVAFIHHSGKDASKGARGHSSLRGAIDTEIEVTYDKATRLHTLEVMKQRDLGSQGMKLTARFLPIEIGVNQWGKAITACVVEQDEPASEHVQAVMRTVENERAEAVTLKGFRLLLAQGVQPTDGNSSRDFLPKQLLAKGLAEGCDKASLEAAMNRLMTRNVFRRAVVGKYASNRADRFGLVLTGSEVTA